MLVGVQADHPESQRITSLIEDTGLADRFICRPFAERGQLRTVYNAADFGVWYRQPSVSIQESMGTGLYMLLADEPTLSHLLIDPLTGRYFNRGDFDEALELIVQTAESLQVGNALGDEASRERRAKANADRFSYLSLARRLVAAAGDLPNSVRHAGLSVDECPESMARSTS
jgi:hypothetical protein